MAKTHLGNQTKQAAKFSSRKYNRCKNCGRRRAYIRRFQICRICFRELALQGKIPGVTKASW